jgi:two-component system OmpR family sensor kinase
MIRDRLRSRWAPNRTLRGRLTVGLVGILLLACALLGGVTALFLRSFLVRQLDGQLAAAGGRFSASLERGRLAPGGEDGDADNAVPGQSVGTIGVRLVGGRVSQARSSLTTAPTGRSPSRPGTPPRSPRWSRAQVR